MPTKPTPTLATACHEHSVWTGDEMLHFTYLGILIEAYLVGRKKVKREESGVRNVPKHGMQYVVTA